MATITADQVKTLRERTGAGMMDCKAALAETGGNMEQAVDVLRKRGLASAARKSFAASSLNSRRSSRCRWTQSRSVSSCRSSAERCLRTAEIGRAHV